MKINSTSLKHKYMTIQEQTNQSREQDIQTLRNIVENLKSEIKKSCEHHILSISETSHYKFSINPQVKGRSKNSSPKRETKFRNKNIRHK